MMTRFALTCAAAAALAGCAANSMETTSAQAVDTSKIPQAGIFAVKDVVVTDQGQDTLRLAAASTTKFTVAELSAVVLCRAREEAVTRKYDGYQADIQNVSNGPGQPQTVIATAHYFKGKPPEGKKTLKQEKSPCHEVPAVAKAKA